MNTFTDRLKIARKARGITQSEAAHLADMGAAQYESYEKGERIPTNQNLRRICEALNVSADWLIGVTQANATAQLPPRIGPNSKQNASGG